MSKFEKLIEYVVNEDMDKARALFHDICVEKSRDIYENLLDEEELDEMDYDHDHHGHGKKGHEDDIDEMKMDEDDYVDEDLPAEEFINNIEADQSDQGMAEMEMDGEMDGEYDADGEMDGDMDGDMDGEEMAGEDNMEDRVVDLEDAFDDLEARFSEIVDGGEYGDEADGEDEDMGMEFDDEEDEGMDDEYGDGEEGEEMDYDSDEDEDEMEETFVREYTEKVATPSGSREVGAGGSVTQNNKDVVAKKRDKGYIDVGRGKAGGNPTPSVGKYADGMDTLTVGKKSGDGPSTSAPTPKKEDPGKGKGPVAKSSKKRG